MIDLLVAVSLASQASVNPNAHALFERDSVLAAWAIRRFDRNRDGWLTLYEAQPALDAFKEMADSNRDGRVSVREFQEAKAFVVARDGLAPGAATAAAR